MQTAQEEEHFGSAVGLTLISSFFMFTCYLYLNEEEVRGFEGTCIRGLMQMACGYVWCIRDHQPTTFPHPHSFTTLCIRNGAMIFYGTSIGVAQFYLPLPIVHTICGSGPICVFIIDYCLNGVKINAKQFVGLAVTMFGLVLAINGGMLIKHLNPNSKPILSSSTTNPRTRWWRHSLEWDC